MPILKRIDTKEKSACWHLTYAKSNQVKYKKYFYRNKALIT